MRKAALITFITLACNAMGQTWIWFPGDMDIWTGNRISNLRTEDGGFFPVFWRTDAHYQTVEFSKTVELDEPEEVEIAAEGRYSVKIDKRYRFGMPRKVDIPAGRHTIKIAVSNIASPPAIWIKGRTSLRQKPLPRMGRFTGLPARQVLPWNKAYKARI